MENNWRNSAKIVRFFIVDGRAMVFFLIALYYISTWTAGLCVVGVTGLTLLENMGYTLPNAYRKLQVLIAGKYRPAVVSRRFGRTDR